MSVIAQLPALLPDWVRTMSTTYLVLSAVVGLPALAILLNVARQVRFQSPRGHRGHRADNQFLPQGKNAPPLVFHIIPWFGSAADYGQDPYAFLFRNRDKVSSICRRCMERADEAVWGLVRVCAFGEKGDGCAWTEGE